MLNETTFPDLPESLVKQIPANETNSTVASDTKHIEDDPMLPDSTLHVYFAQARGGYFGEIHKANDTVIVIGRTWNGFVEQIAKHLRENG